MKLSVRHTLIPLLTAMIWGTAFAMQSICSEHLSPFTINAFRNIIASLILALFCVLTKRRPENRRKLLAGGLICGTALFLASNLQQFGISETSAGKAGFITAMYIVLVPLMGSFLGKKVGWKVWVAVGISVVGMYYLCITGDFSLARGDLFLLLCAAAFTMQILSLDHYANIVDNIALTSAEFFVAGVLSLLGALVFHEHAVLADFQACIGPLLYITVLSSCVAYTLQTVAQKGGNPTVVALIFSMEAVFAVIAGVVLLGERMTSREWLGCLLMTVAIVLAQLPDKKFIKTSA